MVFNSAASIDQHLHNSTLERAAIYHLLLDTYKAQISSPLNNEGAGFLTILV